MYDGCFMISVITAPVFWQCDSSMGMSTVMQQHNALWQLYSVFTQSCWLQLVTQDLTAECTVYYRTPFLIMLKDWSLWILEECEQCGWDLNIILIGMLGVFILSLSTEYWHGENMWSPEALRPLLGSLCAPILTRALQLCPVLSSTARTCLTEALLMSVGSTTTELKIILYCSILLHSQMFLVPLSHVQHVLL
jgi:hypothetical protein